MTKDWKKKIDNEEKVLRAEKKKREEEEKRALQEIADRDRQKKIDWLGKKFNCHICNKPAQHPKYIEGSPNVDGSMGDGWYDWNLPGDLWQCSKCDQWTCKDHIYKDICQKCAEKM